MQEEQQRPGWELEPGEEWMRSGTGARPCRASWPTVKMMALTLREMGGVGAHFPYRILSRGISWYDLRLENSCRRPKAKIGKQSKSVVVKVQDGSSGNANRWSDSQCTLKTEPNGFCNSLTTSLKYTLWLWEKEGCQGLLPDFWPEPERRDSPSMRRRKTRQSRWGGRVRGAGRRVRSLILDLLHLRYRLGAQRRQWASNSIYVSLLFRGEGGLEISIWEEACGWYVKPWD